MAVTYEWAREEVDEYGDIIDHNFAYKLKDVIDEKGRLVLVRDDHDHFGVNERLWAYMESGLMPEFFSDAFGDETHVKVPVRFHQELERNI